MEIDFIDISELYIVPIVLTIVLIPSFLYLISFGDIIYRKKYNSMVYVLVSLLTILLFWQYWLKFWDGINFILKFFDTQVDPVIAYLVFASPCFLILVISITLYSRPGATICVVGKVKDSRIEDYRFLKFLDNPTINNFLTQTLTLKGFLKKKSNSNIFICGSSGSGKTYALTSILSRISETPTIVFSFKAQDHHLKLGFKIVDISKVSVNAFKNKAAFLKAFTVTFLHSEGYIASKIPVIIGEALKRAESWRDIFKYLESKLKTCESDLDAETYSTIIINHYKILEECGNGE